MHVGYLTIRKQFETIFKYRLLTIDKNIEDFKTSCDLLNIFILFFFSGSAGCINIMVRYGRIPSWSFPHITARLPDHFYRHRQELTKPSERVHDRPVPTDFLDYKYDSDLSKP